MFCIISPSNLILDWKTIGLLLLIILTLYSLQAWNQCLESRTSTGFCPSVPEKGRNIIQAIFWLNKRFIASAEEFYGYRLQLVQLNPLLREALVLWAFIVVLLILNFPTILLVNLIYFASLFLTNLVSLLSSNLFRLHKTTSLQVLVELMLD